MDDKLLKIAKSLSSAEIKKLNALHKSKGKLDALLKQKKDLEKKLATVDGKIEKLGSGPVKASSGRGGARKGGKRGGRRGGKSLGDYAAEVLAVASKPMKVAEIADAVLKAGYQTTSAKISPMVTNALKKRNDVVRLEKGLYQTGKAKKAPAKKPVAKKAPVKKAAGKKTPAKKSAPKKAVAKNSPKKRTTKKSAAKVNPTAEVKAE